jgi:hypothetical protein
MAFDAWIVRHGGPRSAMQAPLQAIQSNASKPACVTIGVPSRIST